MRNVLIAFALLMLCVCVCAITTPIVINEVESNPKQIPTKTPTPTLTPTPKQTPTPTIYVPGDYAKIQRAVDNFRWRYNRDGILYYNNNSFRINIIEVVNISSNELGSKNDEIILAEFYDDSYTYIMKRRN